MEWKRESSLIYATVVLAAVAAILSCSPVRREVNGYVVFGGPLGWDSVPIVIGNTMAEDPANPVAALEWRVPLGN